MIALEEVKKSLLKALKNIYNMLPFLFGVLLLISLIKVSIPKAFYPKIFTGNVFIDPFVGAITGSLAIGNPVTSYILGGEFLKQGISLVAVTAFILSWVTVGVIQLPFEASVFGKKFAVARNLLGFGLSILIAILVVLTMGLVI